jgi:hypothetical protein
MWKPRCRDIWWTVSRLSISADRNQPVAAAQCLGLAAHKLAGNELPSLVTRPTAR